MSSPSSSQSTAASKSAEQQSGDSGVSSSAGTTTAAAVAEKPSDLNNNNTAPPSSTTAMAAAAANGHQQSTAAEKAGESTNQSAEAAVAGSNGNNDENVKEQSGSGSAVSNNNPASSMAGFGSSNGPTNKSQQQTTNYSAWPLPPNTYAAGRQQPTPTEEVVATAAKGGEESDGVNKKHDSSNNNHTIRPSSVVTAGSNSVGGNEELSKSDSTVVATATAAAAATKMPPQSIYSSSSSAQQHLKASSSWGNHHPQHPAAGAAGGGARLHHPSHPLHPHHAQYQQWYRHYAHHYSHHHAQYQQQQQHQQHRQGQQQPPQHGPHHAYHHWHRQQQQQQQHYQNQMANNPSSSTATAASTTTSTTTTKDSGHHHPSYHHSMANIYQTRSNDSNSTNVTANGTKRSRGGGDNNDNVLPPHLLGLGTADSRDDSNTLMKDGEVGGGGGGDGGDDATCTMSLGDFSMTSLGSSSPKGKRRKGTGQKYHSDEDNSPNSLSISDKDIMNSLSMNSSYSSELAMLYGGSSPSNSIHSFHYHQNNHHSQEGGGDIDINDIDLGKTPKKNNTSSKKPRPSSSSSDDAPVPPFRLEDMTPATGRFRSASMNEIDQDSSSPALLDLIGGAETPTTGLLMSSIENGMMDDTLSLNRNLRGHAFTPLPTMGGGGEMNMDVMGPSSLNSSGDASALSITPQMSWTANNGSPLDMMTPRYFGVLDSTKSSGKHPLGSPKSFWKENTTLSSSSSSGEKKKMGRGSGEKASISALLSPTMREMEISHDMSMDGRGSMTPLPLNYGKSEQNNQKEKDDKMKKNNHQLDQVKSNGVADLNPKTPVNRPPPSHGGPMLGPGVPPHHQPSPWSNLGTYMPSPVPGGVYRMSPGFGLYPQMGPHPNDRVRNLRGMGPPMHAIPPQHRLPPPSYHHFSPLTNVMQASRVRAVTYQPQQRQQNTMPPQVDVSASSKSNCVPMKPPIPAKFQGDMDKYKNASVPDFNSLVNFPHHMNQKTSPAPDGTRNCVMCGHSCPATGGGKQKGKNNCHPLADKNQNRSRPSGPDNSFATIPSQNKGLCTLCDVNVWIVLQSGLEIKWCKGCKNFRPWASFGEKGLATKCMRCRERQREKYALEKEKKERSKSGRSSSSSVRMMTV